MTNTAHKIIEFMKSHRLLTVISLVLLAPGFIFGLLFGVLGFIGWGRIFLALLILAGYAGYKFVRSQLDRYVDTVDGVVDVSRSLTDFFK